jgi:hypothetical protein
LKRTITKRHKRRILQKKGSLKAMLPDGPPPVPKNKYFKELIKPKITFGFFIPLYLQHQPTCCSAIFFWLLSTLDQITTSRNIVDILLHFIKLKNSHN